MMIVFIAGGCKHTNTTSEETTYTCPMHPEIIKTEAGTCPICGMDLVRLHQHKATKNDTLNLADTGLIDGIIANTKTINPKKETFKDSVILSGKISINTNNNKTVSAYTNGRIEKLYINYNLQQIAKGQKIMDLYSPDLTAAQQELLYLRQKGDVSLMNQAKNKLRLLGMAERDLNQVLANGKINYSISIYSPHSGYVLNNDGNNTEQNLNSSTLLNLRKGMYVKTGDVLFKIYDNSSVWAEFYVNPTVLKNLKPQQNLQISTGKDQWVNVKISSIQQFYKDGQNFSNIRVQLNKTLNKFKIGELVTAKISFDEIKGLLVPETAVYETGGRSIVFIKKGNRLYPKNVVALNIGSKTMIVSGLSEKDEIAENAAHLVDPEAFINIENEKY